MRVISPRGLLAAAGTAALFAGAAAGSAFAQADTTAPTLAAASVSSVGPTQYGTGTAGTTPVFGTGIGAWFVDTTPATPFEGVQVGFSATDDVAVTVLEYSLDNGATWNNVPITAGPSVSGTATITQEGNTTVRFRALDAAGNVSQGVTPAPANTTLNAAATAGATQIRLQSTNGRAAGDRLTIDTGENQEAAEIASIIAGNPAAPNPNVVLTAPLTKAHAAGVAVVAQAPTPAYRTVAVPIDTVAPVVTFPPGANGVNDHRVGHSAVVTPDRTDPAPSSGTPATRQAWLDGKEVTTQPLDASKLSLGKHTWALRVGDTAGNNSKTTLTFVVVASYSDLDALVARYTTPASTTLGAAAVAGATQLQLASPRGRLAGDTLTLGSGDGAETVTIKAMPLPQVTNAVNVTLTAPLTNAHAAGTTVAATSAAAPAISAATGTSLRDTLATAQAASDPVAEIAALEAFVTQASGISNAKIHELLVGDAKDLIRQARGLPDPGVSGLGITTEAAEPTNQHLLILPQSSTLAGQKMLKSAALTGYNPNARFKVLVISNRSDGFRHESIQTYERLVQQLGIEHNFDVDLFDYVYPDESIPNPFTSAENLSKYAVIFGASSVGNNQWVTARTCTEAVPCQGVPAGTVVNEQEAFQGYIRNGGAFAGIHGASDSMHNWDWYKELISGEFQNHGSNTGSMQPQCPSCNITEVVVEDATHPSTKHLPETFIHRDELYNYRTPPREKSHPLLTITDASFSTGFEDGVAPGFNDSLSTINGSAGTNTFNDIEGYGADHPMSWCQNFEGGRVWANILYHNWEPAYQEQYKQNILGGILWAAGAVTGNCVTHRELKTLIASQLTGDAAASATALVDSAYVKYLEKRYGAAMADATALKAYGPIAAKAQELWEWMAVLNGAAIVEGPVGGGVGGTVPATLSLSLGGPASFGAFSPGVTKEYEASTTANVISTAGDATLSVSAPGHLTNGAFSLAEPLQVAFSKSSWNAPVSNDAVDITFKQLVKSSDPLRTGSYSKTLTFTLSTTTP